MNEREAASDYFVSDHNRGLQTAGSSSIRQRSKVTSHSRLSRHRHRCEADRSSCLTGQALKAKPKRAHLASHQLNCNSTHTHTRTYKTVIPTFPRVQTVTMATERSNVSNDLIWQITRLSSRATVLRPPAVDNWQQATRMPIWSAAIPVVVPSSLETR